MDKEVGNIEKYEGAPMEALNTAKTSDPQEAVEAAHEIMANVVPATARDIINLALIERIIQSAIDKSINKYRAAQTEPDSSCKHTALMIGCPDCGAWLSCFPLLGAAQPQEWREGMSPEGESQAAPSVFSDIREGDKLIVERVMFDEAEKNVTARNSSLKKR